MTLAPGAAVGERLAFGDFELAPAARALWRSGAPVKLGSRALDILIALASRPGEILTRDELTQLVWRGALVDETALRVGISAVRKALGEDGERYITTVPGRGYCFVLSVAATTTKLSPEATDRRPLNPQRLPPQIARVVGRDVVIDALAQEVARHRLLSLVGPGGIGKTTVALAVAARLRGAFDAIAFVDLAPIEDGSQMSAGVAAALGLNLRMQQDPIEEIAVAVEGRRVLLLFDNCEHLVDLAAAFVENLLGCSPGVTVLATTRELLRAAGEWVHQLSPLEAPPNSSALSAQDARGYAAVEMFEDRAAFALGGYQLDDADAPYVADICRRLDGIALAIELAAGRLAGLGVQGLAGSLEDCFRVLTHGRRTALPRHQTLRATFDWSYQLLSPEDQAALRRLSVFSGKFTLDDAGAVIGCDQRLTDMGNWLASLLDKSLVVANPAGRTLRYSLLGTTRAYGQEKLIEVGEADLYRQRHAGHFLEAVGPRTLGSVPTPEELAALGHDIDEVRAALDWCFSASGDARIGVALTAAYAPVWISMLLMAECRERTGRVLETLTPQMQLSAPVHLQLLLMHASSLMYMAAPVETVMSAAMKTLELGENLDDVDTQLRALWIAWNMQLGVGECRAALALAERFTTVARRSPEGSDVLVGERLRGRSLEFVGDWGEARQCFARVLASYTAPATKRHALFFLHDQRVQARAMLAQVLCMQGSLDQALAEAEASLEQAQASGNKLAASWTLGLAVYPVALNRGDLATAGQALATMAGLTASINATFWTMSLRCMEGKLLVARGEFGPANRVLESVVDQFETWAVVMPYTEFMAALAESLAGIGKVAKGLDTIERALAWAERGGETCHLPELFRIKGELLLRQGGGQCVSVAEQCFSHALAVAREQGALLWELRSALSLTRLKRTQDWQDQARQVLTSVYARFTEGLSTADLRDARAILETVTAHRVGPGR